MALYDGLGHGVEIVYVHVTQVAGLEHDGTGVLELKLELDAGDLGVRRRARAVDRPLDRTLRLLRHDLAARGLPVDAELLERCLDAKQPGLFHTDVTEREPIAGLPGRALV